MSYAALFIEVPVPSQESERICVLEVSILTLISMIVFLLDLADTVWYFLFFILLTHYGFSLTQHLQNISIR
jgi:hypothetical protein